jgi:hypothetical protein
MFALVAVFVRVLGSVPGALFIARRLMVAVVPVAIAQRICYLFAALGAAPGVVCLSVHDSTPTVF